METIAAARTSIKLWYNNVDISADIAPMLMSLDYTDYGSGKVDDLHVTLQDPDDRWCNAWYPDEGARLRAEIHWSEGSVQRVLKCGEFTVDAPEYSSPAQISLKGTAASVSTSLRREKQTRLWQQVTLRNLADKIAEQQDTSIVFVGPDTPPIAKLEQKDEADLAFLLRQCQRQGYGLKVESNRLVICLLSQIDGQAPAMTIQRRGGRALDWRFGEDTVDAYKACELTYRHPDKGIITATYTPPDAPETGQILKVREHVGSQAEAMRVAKAKLELANRGRMSCDMTHLGDTRLVAGLVVALSGWGVLDGNYTIDEAKHSVGSGYISGLKLVKVI